MKKLFTLITFAFLLCFFAFIQESYAQDVSAKRTEEYCEVRTSHMIFKRKPVAYVDFGGGEQLLKDEQGKEIKFDSSVAVLNYMNRKGWELVTTYVMIDGGDSFTYYVMKRKL